MTSAELVHIAQPEVEITAKQLQAVEELVDSCPWFAYAQLVLLKAMRQNDHPFFDTRLAYASMYATDRYLLEKYLQSVRPNRKPDDFTAPASEELDVNDGFEVIAADEFTDTLPILADEVVVSEPTTTAPLKNKATHINLIDKFIQEDPRLSSARPELAGVDLSTPFHQLPDDAISETLATIYVSQGLVEEAKQVYSKLSLLYPEKKAYFATLFANVQKAQRDKK
ncbi:MAG: hypothetical protein LBK47_01485 [Prevotellaceae bacterium]|jgi:hypothetical protein|nr:hypothetical protein [Prevotellaceae bacterium]